MFKIFGFIIIVFSTTAFFNKNTFSDYITYIFLKETVDILSFLKIECPSRKTYKRIFENMNLKDKKFYENFDFEYRNKFLDDNFLIEFVEKNEIEKVKEFFREIGTKNMYFELEYIENQIKYFLYQKNFYKEKFDKNKQINIISGFSIGIVIFLLII